MDFALCPDTGPPRLLRFDLEGDGVVSILDAEQNLLRINKRLFDQLDANDQARVLRTREQVLWAGSPDEPVSTQPLDKAA
jgi:hypothetical protein